MSPRERAKHVSEKLHGLIHVLIGLIVGFYFARFDESIPLGYLLFLGVFGNLFPDLDHVFSYFTYAKNTDYSKHVKSLLKKIKIREYFEFCKTNHKNNHSILTHNLLSMIIVGLIAVWGYYETKDLYVSTLFTSWTLHYLFDILEDILFFGKINPNWVLKFGDSYSHDNKKGRS